MIITDTISNFFSNINNGLSIKKGIIRQPKSKTIISLLDFFIEGGLIKSYKINKKNSNVINIYMKYHKQELIFKKILRLSKPSKRLYLKKKDILKLSGFLIISTKKGFLTEKQAIQQKIGGELIGKICF